MRSLLPCLLFCGLPAVAQHDGHHVTQGSDQGMVMNQNTDALPGGCRELSGDVEFTVRAGRRYAADRPGVVFGMNVAELAVAPCSRVTVHFINEDEVRHQWMVHGLPRYLYPGGMFHVEAMGGGRQSGTFIVPAEHRNYLVHCDMAQHMEKGMRGQLVVGGGDGNLWGVPGLSDAYLRASYLPAWTVPALCLTLLAALAVTLRARS